jgi:hypothetical protein
MTKTEQDILDLLCFSDEMSASEILWQLKAQSFGFQFQHLKYKTLGWLIIPFALWRLQNLELVWAYRNSEASSNLLYCRTLLPGDT